MSPTPPRFLNAGEAAIVVEFGATVDAATNARVLALDAALVSLALPGIRETVPTYRSLMIHYDPLVINRQDVIETVRTVEENPNISFEPENRWIIPCCYDPPFGEEIDQIADMAGMTRERVIALHSEPTYRVYMYGFAPGFCYLGGLPKELAISRRPTPRSPHPPNTVLVGGGMTLISTISMPTGWWLVGRTPERMFSLSREPNFLVKVGDALRFEQIDAKTFESLEARSIAGDIVAKRERPR
jgi:KipI family sensor histidine kinase inhibitor